MSDKIVIEGVRECLRCDECGRYDTDLGATSEERTAIHDHAFKLRANHFLSVYCDCYEASENNGDCPKCGRDLELWDDDQQKLFDGGVDLVCRCGAHVHATASVEYRTELRRPGKEGL